MKLSKKMNLIFPLVLVGCLLFSSPPAARGFITLEKTLGRKLNILIHKVHKPEWQIGYRYSTTCTPAQRRDKVLQAALTNAFRLWLEPLQGVAKQPLVDSFRYRLDADQEVDNWDLDGNDDDDLRVFFRCIFFEASRAVAGAGFPPHVYIAIGKADDIKPTMYKVDHEVGHAFGLHDTYIVDRARDKSTGGLARTKGKQPASVMSSHYYENHNKLGEDDINGIIWLYKAAYEGLGAFDCFFPDYVYEVETSGCRPKYPLIFEIKHGQQFGKVLAAQMLDDDPNLDINARDASGRTALHYAVMYEQRPVVGKLLDRPDIKLHLSDKQGKTAAELAKETGQDDIAERILAHPRALSVSPKGKKNAVTWGELKHGD